MKAFLFWCARHPTYKTIVTGNAAQSKDARERLGRPKVKNDVLQREQLPAWLDSWRPEQQQAAETLALLAALIAMGISHQSASLMFEPQFVQRHFENAKEIGAIMSLTVAFKYRVPGDSIDRQSAVDIHIPGTKLTPKMAMYAAQQFLEHFGNTTPTAHVNSTVCKVKSSGELVFEMRFHAEIQALDPTLAEGKP